MNCQEGDRCSDSKAHVNVDGREHHGRGLFGVETAERLMGQSQSVYVSVHAVPSSFQQPIPTTVKHETHEVCGPGHSNQAQLLSLSLLSGV